jgi:hypothetical protein
MVTSNRRLDRTFGALADPIRRAILDRLAHHEASVGGLARPSSVSRPAISSPEGAGAGRPRASRARRSHQPLRAGAIHFDSAP